MYSWSSRVQFSDEIMFLNNSGSLLIYYSNFTISGKTTFINCTQSSRFVEGGAISSFRSSIYSYGITRMSENSRCLEIQLIKVGQFMLQKADYLFLLYCLRKLELSD